MASFEKEILEFRKAYINLPEAIRKKEVSRLHRISERQPIFVLEDHDKGKIVKFLDIGNLMEYLWKEKKIRSDRSYLYKVLKGKGTTAYGYLIYYEYEEI